MAIETVPGAAGREELIRAFMSQWGYPDKGVDELMKADLLDLIDKVCEMSLRAAPVSEEKPRKPNRLGRLIELEEEG